jgi:predicted lipoprotein with Yx(FWY)xxD motif
MKKISLLFLVAALMLIGFQAAIADARSVRIMNKESTGKYLANGKGRAFYWLSTDAPGKRTRSRPGLRKWPPVALKSKVKLPATLKSSDFDSIVRADGKKQSTFRGYPLYYFARDRNAGDTKGHGLHNAWHLVNPDDFPPR